MQDLIEEFNEREEDKHFSSIEQDNDLYIEDEPIDPIDNMEIL